MYRTSVDSRPSAQHDAKWVSGVLLALFVAVGLLFFSLARISRPEPARTAIRTALEAELFPQGMESAAPLVALAGGLDYQPGQPFTPVPGIDVTVREAELPDLDAAAARQRVAAELADAIVGQGLGAASAKVSDPRVTEQLAEAGQGTLQAIVRSYLTRAMLPSGLADGSRLADWPLQVQRNPGEPVQPVVGVFLRFDPEVLSSLSDSEIGLLVIDRLASLLLEQGLGAAQDVVSNSNLLARLTEAGQGEVHDALQAYLATLLVPQDSEIEARLAGVRKAMAAGRADEGAGDVLAGLTSRRDLAGLSAQEANRRVLTDLAGVVYEQGPSGALSLVPDEGLRARLRSAMEGLGAYTRSEHGRFVRFAWLFGLLSLVFLGVLLGLSRGLGRLLSAGLALLAAPLLGLLAFGPLWRGTGVLVPMSGLWPAELSFVSESAARSVLQTHLWVMAVGAGLIALLIVLKLLGLFGPKRRKF
ncbi:MAG TPA: hypothetical protein VF171_04535 [Trueperaceae bacterium]